MSSNWAKAYADRGLQRLNKYAIPPNRANSVIHFDAETVKNDAAQARLLVHSRFPQLIERFLAHKRRRGTAKEKLLYANMTVGQEIARLFRNRPQAFVNSTDDTVLRDGLAINNAAALWDAVGTAHEGKIRLDEYLSYDEIMLSSFIGCSGPSFFINDGDRYNSARPGKPGTFETRGIIAGLVGARFERPGHMDYRVVHHRGPRADSELTEMILEFLGVKNKVSEGFDYEVYTARMKIPIILLLSEAQLRAQAVSPTKKAYVHIVGLGLGVWQIDRQQADGYMQAWFEVLKEYGRALPNVGVLDFAYIDVDNYWKERVKSIARKHGIQSRVSKRNPAAKLEGEDADHLLVVSYAWDGNSYPGNEYWMSSLTASGDPAAAAMSTIAEIHNPETNPQIWQSYENHFS
ncbi:hypothetical protein GGR53DRAFT_372743 [Hypoxylon sp. FL1150]|nr:hypothetical protein GGR53DRAFT_372743 [Hypoxylon sp. FL1150]